MYLTYRFRVKSLTGELNRQARAVNFVWNFCNDTQKHALKWCKKWPSAFDLDYLTAGSYSELGLHSGTISAVGSKYVSSRAQSKRPALRYRGRRSLGWVPIKGRDLKREGDSFRFMGKTFRIFDSRSLPVGRIKDGSSFSQDSKGNWFINVVVEVADTKAVLPTCGVGIDLGLKELAVLSDGSRFEHPRSFANLESKLSTAQRAGKKRLAKSIHARISNVRRDFLHKSSREITERYDYIAVGNVSSSKLAKTKMAKSVYDASWSSLKNMISYKAIARGSWYEEVNESFTTQTCSCCGSLSDTRPRGIAGLGIREWTCSDCGTVHDRDTNAAINILLRSGYRTPAEGITAFTSVGISKSTKEQG